MNYVNRHVGNKNLFSSNSLLTLEILLLLLYVHIQLIWAVSRWLYLVCRIGARGPFVPYFIEIYKLRNFFMQIVDIGLRPRVDNFKWYNYYYWKRFRKRHTNQTSNFIRIFQMWILLWLSTEKLLMRYAYLNSIKQTERLKAVFLQSPFHVLLLSEI